MPNHMGITLRSFAAFRATSALILREMSTSFGRTPGGYFWAIIEPVAAVSLLTFVFSLAFDQPPIGKSFALFYATGYLPFMLYSDLAQKIGVSLRFSRPLLAYPAVTWWDALLARFILNALTHTLVFMLVIGGIIILSGRPVVLDLPRVFLGLSLAAGLGFGIGALNAFLFEMFPIWERIWAILNRPLFIISGVLFLPEGVPMPYDDWLWFNPIAHVIGFVRAGIYPAYSAHFSTPLYPVFIALSALALAMVFLGRHARRLLSEG